MDTICLKPLDELTHKFSFFAGMEPAGKNYNSPAINGGAIGTVPNHPIVKRAIKIIDRYYNENDTDYRKMLNEYSSDHVAKGTSDIRGLIAGQLAYPLAIFEICKDLNYTDSCKDIIIFPPIYLISPFLHNGGLYLLHEETKT